MDVVLLRKLTEKSKLGFGKYATEPIWYILQSRHTQYLRYIYYCCSGITFTDDILQKIGIDECNRIEKPGTNVELHEKVSARKFISHIKHCELSGGNQAKINAICRWRKKQRNSGISKMSLLRNEIKFLSSKSLLQSKNHNHR